MKYSIETQLPNNITAPLRFREPDQDFEGEVDHPLDIVRMFEPIDVLNGATELVDASGKIIIVTSENMDLIEKNEYPKDLQGLYYEIKTDL